MRRNIELMVANDSIEGIAAFFAGHLEKFVSRPGAAEALEEIRWFQFENDDDDL